MLLCTNQRAEELLGCGLRFAKASFLFGCEGIVTKINGLTSNVEFWDIT
jgi:hypothetical protein